MVENWNVLDVKDLLVQKLVQVVVPIEVSAVPPARALALMREVLVGVSQAMLQEQLDYTLQAYYRDGLHCWATQTVAEVSEKPT